MSPCDATLWLFFRVRARVRVRVSVRVSVSRRVRVGVNVRVRVNQPRPHSVSLVSAATCHALRTEVQLAEIGCTPSLIDTVNH